MVMSTLIGVVSSLKYSCPNSNPFKVRPTIPNKATKPSNSKPYLDPKEPATFSRTYNNEVIVRNPKTVGSLEFR